MKGSGGETVDGSRCRASSRCVAQNLQMFFSLVVVVVFGYVLLWGPNQARPRAREGSLSYWAPDMCLLLLGVLVLGTFYRKKSSNILLNSEMEVVIFHPL